MKRAIVIFIILTLFNPPIWATQWLSPKMEDWARERAEDVQAIALLLYDLKAKEEPAEREEIKSRIEDQLRAIDAIPYWETLAFNPDNSIEIVIDYREGDRSNPVITKFEQIGSAGYPVAVIGDEPQANNRIARGALGLNLSRVLAPGQDLEQVTRGALPQALAFRRGLVGDTPETGDLAYLYTATQAEPVQEVLGAIQKVQERAGVAITPIKAVVVLGTGGQSLGNRTVVQVLGRQEVKFIFPDNITNLNRWLAELKGINPENVLLYVSSKTGDTDETMVNFWFFWKWMINKLGQPQVASSLLEKLQGVNLANVKLSKLTLSKKERALLNTTLNRIAVSTTHERQGPIYNFAVNNNIPIVPLQAPIEEGYAVLSRSGQFTAALAGYDIERMRQAVVPLANAFKEDKPELNPALETAMYAYASGMPILAAVSTNERLTPLFEWARQLVNESLGKEGKGPYLTFATGNEASQALMKAPKNKLFLVINVGEEKLDIPAGVRAIEINIPEINEETLARLFLFLEEFTVRYGTLLGVNPVTQPWVARFEEILTEGAMGFDTSQAARERRNAGLNAIEKLSAKGGVRVPEALTALLSRLTETDQDLTATGQVQVPGNESEFHGLLDIGNYRQPDELEAVAQNLALQLYSAEKLGKTINPFFIYSASPEARLVGEFIKYLGQRRVEKLGGGILWDYLIGTTNHPTAQFLGQGNDIAITTFLHFLQESEPNPPVLASNGLIHERLNGKTPKEVSTLNMEALRQALNNEGRTTNTLEVPNEKGENLAKIYQLLVRTSELYSRLWEYENKGGTTLDELAGGNESVVVEPEKGARAGSYTKESPQEPVDLYGVTVPMYIGGVVTKTFIHPQVGRISGEVSSALKQFRGRVVTLARTIAILTGRQGSALNRFVTAEGLKEQAKPEFYAFRLEDVIAKVEVGSEVGDTLWEEIRIGAANTMIAKTVKELRRANPKAKVIVYTANPKLTERRINAALDAIDSGGVFDIIVCGDTGRVLAEISDRKWANTRDEAVQKTVFASAEKTGNLKTVIVPNEKFIPFPELATIMQAILRTPDTEGKLAGEVIESILASYTVWLEFAGFNKGEIVPYIEDLRRSLSSGMDFVVSLPVPPPPKPGSVIQLLDKEYEEVTRSRSFA